MAVRVVSDSACDLPPALCDELGIEIVPLTIRFGADELVDRVELTTEAFWDASSRASTVLPETAAPSVGAFESTFRSLHDSGADGIVCINLSSQHVGDDAVGPDRGEGARRRLPGRGHRLEERVDGHRHALLEAARRAREGADLGTIVPRGRGRARHATLLFTVDTLEYLRKGGRIGGAQAMLGSMLSIKPVITVNDGAVEPAARCAPDRRRCASSSTA